MINGGDSTGGVPVDNDSSPSDGISWFDVVEDLDTVPREAVSVTPRHDD